MTLGLAIAVLYALASSGTQLGSFAPVGASVNEESTCRSTDGAELNMSELTITLGNVVRDGRFFYTISGDKIIISRSPQQRVDILIYDSLFLTNSSFREGLALFHARRGSQRYIYWIDKRVGDLSRNGLLRIDGSTISLECTGRIHR